MKKLFIIIYFHFILSLSPTIVNSGENKILVKVNNQIITSLDIMSEIKYLETINNDLKKFDNSKIIDIAKKSLIRDKIKEIELKKIFEKIKIKEKKIMKI